MYNLNVIYSYSELIEKHKSRRTIDRLIRNGVYKKIVKGIYTNNNDYSSSFEVLCKTYDNITITLQSAAAYYDLTDLIPDKYYVASLAKGTIIKRDDVNQSFMRDIYFYVGREKISTDSGFIYVYNKERLLIEIIRLKKKLPYDFYKEVCNSYRDLVKNNKIDLAKIAEYAKTFNRKDGILSTILEVILWQ